MMEPVPMMTCCVDDLHWAAMRKTGLTDFGDASYLKGLNVLLSAFDTDLHLTEEGRQSAYNSVLRILGARLFAQCGWRQFPDVASLPLDRPLVITGLPRTGTTALHRLLGTDPLNQGIEAWLQDAPQCRPSPDTREAHPEFRAYAASYDAFSIRVPELESAHDFAPAELEECTGILVQNFTHHVWAVGQVLPTYARWFESQSTRDSYLRYANVLRLIGSGEPDRRWLLKSPYHMFDIEELLAVLPTALIVQTHRDPMKVFPSLCSLTHMYRRNLEGGGARREIIGPWLCTHWKRALERMERARRKAPAQFFDVDHRDFLADPMAVVRSMYEYFGLTLSRAAETQMHAWIAASPIASHGKHRYEPTGWGITSEHIGEMFADYMAQHRFS